MIKTIITGDLGVNTYLYNYKDKNVVIIDPGSDATKIISAIKESSHVPTGILLTHGHFDHIGAVTEIRNKYKIDVYIHTDDATFLGEEGEQRHKDMFQSMGPQGSFYFKHYFDYTDKAENLVNDKEILANFGLEIIHTPGHSPGGCCFYSKENSIIFTGDTLFNGGLGRTDFIGGNYDTLINSLKKLFDLPKNTKVYPGHGAATTIGSEQ